MHLDSTDDPRPRIRRSLAELVEDLEREAPPRVVLAALVDAAKRLHLRIEGDPIRPARSRRVAS
jgi:hypothetical protein